MRSDGSETPDAYASARQEGLEAGGSFAKIKLNDQTASPYFFHQRRKKRPGQALPLRRMPLPLPPPGPPGEVWRSGAWRRSGARRRSGAWRRSDGLEASAACAMRASTTSSPKGPGDMMGKRNYMKLNIQIYNVTWVKIEYFFSFRQAPC